MARLQLDSRALAGWSPSIGAVRVRVLGTVDVVADDGAVVTIGSRSQRIVLAVLASQAGAVVAPDRLVDALWPEGPPRTAVDSLRTYVSRLRRVVGDGLSGHPGGYVLDVTGGVDADEFDDLVRRADTAAAHPAEAAGLWEEALARWRGPAFGDLATNPVLRPPAVRLDETRRAARVAHAKVLLAAGRSPQAAAAAEEIVAAEPVTEGAWVVLVDALRAADRAPEALRSYQRAVAALAEAGLVPGDDLRRAEAEALAGGPPALEPRRLPVPASSLVGRSADFAAVARLLGDARMVTLTGPGGVGKSRLALAVAAHAATVHEAGARLVLLSRVDEPGAVAGVAADALGLAVAGGSVTEALGRAGALDLLVVLDNCEHVVDEAARVAHTLVTGGPQVRVLATSRERLGVDGEHVWPVHPLGVDGEHPAAQHLFADRLRAAGGPRTAEDDAAVDRIVRRLDGLPLAIEMAAARAATLGPALVADQIEGELAPLDVLVSPRRTDEPRHHTLSAVVAWSEALLDADERALLADLGAFAGFVPPADIEAVVGRADALDLLGRLADRSLVLAEPRPQGVRFGMLATVRGHARRRLAAAPGDRAARLAEAHARHMTEAAEAADAALRTPDEPAAHARLDELGDELRRAHRWALAHDLELAVRQSAALHVFAQSRLREEPLAWAAALAARADGLPRSPATAGALASAAQRAANAGDLARGEALAERALAVAGDSPGAALPLYVLSDIALFSGRLDSCAELARRCMGAAERGPDLYGQVGAACNLAMAQAYAGRHDDARATIEHWAGQWDEARLSPSEQGWLAYTRGECTLDRDPPAALAHLERAIEHADTAGNRYLGGVARVSASSLQARTGEPEAALAAFARAIEHWRRETTVSFLVTTLRNLVVLLARLGWAAEAAELAGTVASDAAGPTYGEEAARLAEAQAWARERLGPAAFADHTARGAARSVVEAGAMAALLLDRREGGEG
jgi:predicted ATPase/DNA-binding SARP family transcriptional activator